MLSNYAVYLACMIYTGHSPVQYLPTTSPPPSTARTKSLSTRTTSTAAGNHVTFCLPPENDTRQQRPSTTTMTNAALSTDIEDDCCDRFLRNHLADVSSWRHSSRAHQHANKHQLQVPSASKLNSDELTRIRHESGSYIGLRNCTVMHGTHY